MKILIINSGSSSIKYQLMVMPENEVICTGMIDRIGLESSNVTFKASSNSYEVMSADCNTQNRSAKSSQYAFRSRKRSY